MSNTLALNIIDLNQPIEKKNEVYKAKDEKDKKCDFNKILSKKVENEEAKSISVRKSSKNDELDEEKDRISGFSNIQERNFNDNNSKVDTKISKPIITICKSEGTNEENNILEEIKDNDNNSLIEIMNFIENILNQTTNVLAKENHISDNNQDLLKIKNILETIEKFLHSNPALVEQEFSKELNQLIDIFDEFVKEPMGNVTFIKSIDSTIEILESINTLLNEKTKETNIDNDIILAENWKSSVFNDSIDFGKDNMKEDNIMKNINLGEVKEKVSIDENEIVQSNINSSKNELEYFSQKSFGTVIQNNIDKEQLARLGQNIYSNVNGEKVVLHSFDKEDLFNQIAEKIRLDLKADHSEIKVRLKPEVLGEMSLKVVLEKGMLTAKALVESYQVKQLIETNLTQLKDTLKEQGFEIQNFEVTVGRDSNFNGQGFLYNHNGQAGKFKKLNSNGYKSQEIFEELPRDNSNSYILNVGTIDIMA